MRKERQYFSRIMQRREATKRESENAIGNISIVNYTFLQTTAIFVFIAICIVIILGMIPRSSLLQIWRLPPYCFPWSPYQTQGSNDFLSQYYWTLCLGLLYLCAPIELTDMKERTHQEMTVYRCQSHFCVLREATGMKNEQDSDPLPSDERASESR